METGRNDVKAIKIFFVIRTDLKGGFTMVSCLMALGFRLEEH